MSSPEDSDRRVPPRKGGLSTIPRGMSVRCLDQLDIFPTESTEASFQTGGSMFANSGVAFARLGDVFYMIDANAPDEKAVRTLSRKELATLHMRNYHLDQSRVRLSAEEIGEYPFQRLLERLRIEKSLHFCLDTIDTVLNPLNDNSLALRGEISMHIETFLREHPDKVQPIINKIKSFIPPEGYELSDLDEAVGRSNVGGRFTVSCPLLFQILSEAQLDWERNTLEHSGSRLTLEQIQQHNDEITELASMNLLERAKKYLASFAQAIEALEKKRQNKDTVLFIYGLAEAKGDFLSLEKNLPLQRERFAETENRRPGVWGRFEEASSVTAEAAALLPALERLIGEPIKASNISG